MLSPSSHRGHINFTQNPHKFNVYADFVFYFTGYKPDA